MSPYYSLRKAVALSRRLYFFKIKAKDERPVACWRSIAPWTRKGLPDLSGGRFIVVKNDYTFDYYFAKINWRVEQDFYNILTDIFINALDKGGKL